MAKKPTGSRAKYEQREVLIPADRRYEGAKWQKSHGMFIAGQSMIDEVTLLANELQRKWGAGRLRLIVGEDLRAKFDRQRYKFNQAIWHGTLEEVRQEGGRMVKAWQALDRAASESGLIPQAPQVWDIEAPSGLLYVFARNRDDAKAHQREGREVRMFSLEEVVAILDAQEALQSAKGSFVGCEVVRVAGGAVGDVLDDIWDSSVAVDDPLDDPVDDIPF